MRVRVALWWVALCASIVGLCLFLTADFGVERTSWDAYAPLVSRTGAELLALGFSDGVQRLQTTVGEFGSADMYPDPPIWMMLATLSALLVPLLLRMRPTPRTRRILIGITAVVTLFSAGALLGMHRTPSWQFGMGIWAWLGAVVLLVAAPWLRRRDQLIALHAWETRPAKPTGPLGPLNNITAPLRSLVHETRAVRTSLDVLSGLDAETTRLVWDWQHAVAELPPDETALLSELGLASRSAIESLSLEGATDAERLLELDKALCGFEVVLGEYRSFGFR
ncbi:MAG: hypothetical protein AAF721_39700 [Myxococcota bacterium]